MKKREAWQRLAWWVVILVNLFLRSWWISALACAAGIGLNVYLLRTREKDQPKLPCQVAIGLFSLLLLASLVSAFLS